MSNAQLLALMEEVDGACSQLNSMSYNNKHERDLMDKHIDRLDDIEKEMSGDMSAILIRKNTGTIVLQ